MPMQASPVHKRDPGASLRPGTDRRRHKRYALVLLGRFMRADRHEYACRLQDISVGGASISSPVQPEIGEQIVIYLEELGGLEGEVTRHLDGGFAISLRATRHRREKLAARITWLVNRGELGGLEAREHERTAPDQNQNTLKIGEDITLAVSIIDVSLSGANIATEVRPPVGTEVQLGKLRAKVMRHHERGIGVRFLDIQDPEALRRSFG